MKLSKILLFAGVGVAAGLLLVRTEKGKEIKDDLANELDKLSKKLSKLTKKAKDEASHLAEESVDAANRFKNRAKKELA